jgi:hypothetical protein
MKIRERIVLTDKQRNAVLELRKSGMGWRKIAKKLNLSYFAIRGNLENGFRELQAERVRRIRAGDLSRGYQTGLSLVPQSVLDERERRLALQPRDLTASILGDPPPGYSALDTWEPIGRAALRVVGRLA